MSPGSALPGTAGRLSRRGVLAGAGGIALSALGAPPARAAAARPLALSVRGADMSFLPQLEEAGVRFTDLAGRIRPAERILAHQGANYLRLRVWVNPPPGYSDKARALALAKRARRAGMQILLDPHYSDFWADPGKQVIPASWPTGLDELTAKIRSYTRELVCAFADQGTPVDILQVGNEITNGTLWPAGQLYLSDGTQQWPQFAQLLKAGIAGRGRRPIGAGGRTRCGSCCTSTRAARWAT